MNHHHLIRSQIEFCIDNLITEAVFFPSEKSLAKLMTGINQADKLGLNRGKIKEYREIYAEIEADFKSYTDLAKQTRYMRGV